MCWDHFLPVISICCPASLLTAAPPAVAGRSLHLCFPSDLRTWCSVQGECLYECFQGFPNCSHRRAVERQLPWPPLEHSDLASLGAAFLLQKAQSDCQPANRCFRPCSLWAFRPYPVNVLLFSHLPHIKTQTMQTKLHLLHFISLISNPSGAPSGFGRAWEEVDGLKLASQR